MTSSTIKQCFRRVFIAPAMFVRGLSFYNNFIIKETSKFLDRIAMRDIYGNHSYGQTLNQSFSLAEAVHQEIRARSDQRHGHSIGFLCSSSFKYVASQFACWLGGNIAVPLCQMHPEPQLEYHIIDAHCSVLLATSEFIDALKLISENKDIPLINVDTVLNVKGSPERFDVSELEESFVKEAAIVYTSGTTGKPKGVVLTHENLKAMVTSLVKAWELQPSDVFLHTLPLHHLHGIVNSLLCPLYVGATCVMLPKFDARQVWDCLIDTSDLGDISVFMGVPTMYAKLAQEYKNNLRNTFSHGDVKEFLQKKMRLMISGSSALPQPIMEGWKNMFGVDLLERYGMSEVGMALSNPLHGKKIPGCVGQPLPGVEVRIVDKGKVLVEGNETESKVLCKNRPVESGELLVRGPAVFDRYWNRPEASLDAFTSDQWFKTGDVATYLPETNSYKILGRSSVDIIKRGGFKISTLDIERHLLSRDDILDCAVIGIPDEMYGEVIIALIQCHDRNNLTLPNLSDWCRSCMSKYHVPKRFIYLESIPRNNMGKVDKKDLVNKVITGELQ